MKKLFKILIMCLLILILSAPASAHKVQIFAIEEGAEIYTQGYFSDGKPAQDSVIEVFDSKGTRIVDGRTNKDGEFTFTPAGNFPLRIVLNASMGHRAEYLLEAPGNKTVRSEEPADAPTGTNGEELRQIIDEELSKRLDPIVRSIVETNKKGPSVSEILGGIGYIFGIMGIVMYYSSKGKR